MKRPRKTGQPTGFARPLHFLHWIGSGLLALCTSFLLIGCSQTEKNSMNPLTAYQTALATSTGHQFAPESPEEKAAIARFSNFFGNLNEESAVELTRQTYAEPIFFYDTLKTITNLSELEEYFLETAQNTESVQARVLDVARSNGDYYLRWEMDIQLKKFRRGETLRSVGMTHLRFNPDGKIILHHDYWDSTEGFFQHVPVLGGVIRYIKTLF